MKCPHCDRKVANDSIFCEYCGAKISKNSKTSWIVLAIVLGIAIQCLFGFFCYKYFSLSKNIAEPIEVPIPILASDSIDIVEDGEAVAQAEAEKVKAEAEKAIAEAQKAEEETKKEEAKARQAEARARIAEANAKKASAEAEAKAKAKNVVKSYIPPAQQNADSTKTSQKSDQVIQRDIPLQLKKGKNFVDIFGITEDECRKIKWESADKKIVSITRSATNRGIKAQKEGKTVIIGKKDGKVKYKLTVTVK